MILWWLEQRLKSNDDQTVVNALRALAARPGSRSVAMICCNLHQFVSRPVCYAACGAALGAIAKVQSDRVAEALRQTYSSNGPRSGWESGQARALSHALIEAGISDKRLCDILLDESCDVDARVELATALGENPVPPDRRFVFRHLLEMRDHRLREAAVSGLAACGDETDAVRLTERMRGDRATSVRRTAARLLGQTGRGQQPVEAELAVVAGDRGQVLASGAAALPFLLRELALLAAGWPDEDVPKTLELIETLLRTDAQSASTPTLQAIAALADPVYWTQGAGHQTHDRNSADATSVRELARGELTRR